MKQVTRKFKVENSFVAFERRIRKKSRENSKKFLEYSRDSRILPRDVGQVILVHNGLKPVKVNVRTFMIGELYGKYVRTRRKPSISKKGKAKRR